MSQLDLSQEEERILRSFYRRHAMPYVAATAAVAIVAIGISISGGGSDAAADAEAARAEGAKLVQLRGEVQQLLGALEEVRRQTQAEVDRAEERVTGLADKKPTAPARAANAAPSAEVTTLKKRVDAAVRRLEKAESRLDEVASAATARPAAAAPPDDAAAWDVGSILERLYDAELRLDGFDKKSESLSQGALARLETLESLQEKRTNESVEVEKSILNRLYSLETRFSALEEVAVEGASTSPASPASN